MFVFIPSGAPEGMRKVRGAGCFMPDAPNPADPLPFRIDGRVLETARDVAAYFDVPLGRLLWTLYKAPETVRYRAFEIPKRTGGMRPIHAPHGLVRDLQDKLKADLDKLYAPHPNAHGFIVEKSVASNAKPHAGKRWVLNIDLQDFFPSVNFGRVRGLFMRPPFDMAAAAATVCAQIVTHKNGLPQGAPTSPVLSNLIAVPLDRALLRLARGQHVTYSRYADDITFSTDDATFPPALAVKEQAADGAHVVVAGDELAKAVAACGFRINPKKVRLQGRGVRQSVTGLGVNVRVNVDRARIRKLRAMLHAWDKFGIEAAGTEHFKRYRGRDMSNGPRNAGRAFRTIVYGHLSFVKMVRGTTDPLFLKLCARVLDLDPNPSKFIRQMVFGADDYEIFLSHASEDKAEIARPIFAACSQAGLKAFLDEDHIGWGENFTKKINTALGAARTVLVIVSSHSVSKDWPVAEINTALAFEVEGKKRVLALVVGKPDLSKLPLIKTKNFMSWDGDAGKVAARLATMVRPPPQKPVASRPSVPVIAPRKPFAKPVINPVVAPPMRAKRGFFAWLFGIER
jgi:RNA-directed DNA polymerase